MDDQNTVIDSEPQLSAVSEATEAPFPDTPSSDTPLSEAATESSPPFVGQWNGLVSTTNWEKGRIIGDWRTALEESGAEVTEYSDEAWAQLVGHVTSQHVGRLRRVHDRFGKVREEYEGLYWSHFQSALDWDDAEMWLEGGVTNGWSVSQMRAARWEAVGAPDGVKPTESEVIEAELDEDSYTSLADQQKEGDFNENAAEAETVNRETAPSESAGEGESDGDSSASTEPAEQRVRPFEQLGELPDDLAEAFEQFKLVILSHKLTGWEAISQSDMLESLDALKALALAPPAED